ncbi:EthD domain-containing protein [Rhizobium leguminosarum]|uniref:EthD domain-containing protein n=1 Tax=Rhizobium leguminosarum TaxID=384 RepID=UPI001CDC7725|nr:EthD domain-containing protein [Rhizobium leguminosarum]MCA2436013.1 EthD domain-containing protein [Rhizobium leguminosarum]
MTRRADLSFEDFSDYWVNKHWPPVQTIRPIMENAVRYAQQHSINAVPEGVPAAPYDGVAELWFESQENFFKVATSPESETVMKDTENFADTSRILVLFTEERVSHDR